MPRIVLAASTHSGQLQAVAQGIGQRNNCVRLAMKSAVADHTRRAIIQIEYRRKGIIDTTCPKLRRQHVTYLPCRLAATGRILIPQTTQGSHCWQTGKTLAEALHPAPFVVDGNQ